MWGLLWAGLVWAASPLVIRDARVVDADGAREVGDLLVVDGRIAALGPDLELPPDTRELPGRGSTVLPGLIDSHVHLSMSPSAALRQPGPEARLEEWRMQLRGTLAAGVTTVLDTGILAEDARALRRLATEGPAPRIELLGPLLSPADGYVHAVLADFPEVQEPAEVGPLLDRFADLQPRGVKLTVEPGMLRPIWPLYSAELRVALVEQSEARGLPRYVHAMKPEASWLALELQPHALVHPNEDPEPAWIDAVVERGIYVMSTLAVTDSLFTAVEPERLEDPLLQRVVPPVQLDAAADPELQRASRRAVAEVLLPRLPAPLRSIGVWATGRRTPLDAFHRRQLEAVAQLHAGGVELVLGSDAGNWPLFVAQFHGASTLRELELLVEAGLSPLEAITAATATPARMLGLEERIGRVRPGMVADLLVVSADPLADVGVLRQLDWVIQAGEARTPVEWMQAESEQGAAP